MEFNWKSLVGFLLFSMAASSIMRMAGVPEMIRIVLMIGLAFAWPYPMVK